MIHFSFIILFHNNSDTDRVVDSILNEFIEGDEIIVVDDYSENENLHLFDRFGDRIRLVHSDRGGNRGYNRNYGASIAKNNHYLFVDGDMVFLPNAITAMRVSMEQGYVGAVGNVICSDNTSAHMNLLTGIDYLNLIRTNLTPSEIIHLGIFYDNRQSDLYEKIAVNTLWEYFYAGYCAVEKMAFQRAGGFETCFVGWGVEDDELGYRLHLEGKIDYNLTAYAVHIPHERNRYKCLLSNRVNMYRFLAKTPTNQVEFHMTFGNNAVTWNTIGRIRTKLLAVHTELFDFPLEDICIGVNEMTEQYPSGYVEFTDQNGQRHSLELLGLALPFRNKNFQYGFCSENLFVYPEFLCAAILNKLLRVSCEVRVLKTTSHKRICWNSEQIPVLTCPYASERILYLPSAICDFDIKDCGTYYRIRDGVAARLNDHFLVEENFYQPELFEPTILNYLLLNLTGEPTNSDQYAKLEQQYHIQIQDCYNFKIPLTSPVQLSDVIAGDLYRLHIPMLYLIPSGCEIDRNDLWWQPSFRERDIIVQNS